jgi:hypothetical protein
MGLTRKLGVKIFEFSSTNDNGPSEQTVRMEISSFLEEKELDLENVQITSAIYSQLMPPIPGSGSSRQVTVRTTSYTVFYEE